MNPDSTIPLLQKLCELQQQQLDKLAELSNTAAEVRKSYESYQRHFDESSERLSSMAADSHKSYERYERQLDAYEQALQKYQTDEPKLTRSAIVIATMLGLLALSIIVSRFL